MNLKRVWNLTLLIYLTVISAARAEEKVKNSMMMMSNASTTDAPIIEGVIPEFDGVVKWYNSKPLSVADLRGHVVLVDFWTYSCINCLRTLPYVKAWSEKYKGDGLIVIGVHSPEFGFEKDPKNIVKAIKKLGINYPVADDSHYRLWNGFKNRFWPAHYFIDRLGRIRQHHFGEGEYAESENVIRKLLEENGKKLKPEMAKVITAGVGKTFDLAKVKTPETYLGHSRAENFAGVIKKNQASVYKATNHLSLNQWSLDGKWLVEEERSISKSSSAKIRLKFKAKDVHLVLGSKSNSTFRVTLDGKAPLQDKGEDIDQSGNGTITTHRLYQLIRQKDSGVGQEHVFEIEFSSPDVEVYAFTFG